MTYQEAIDKRTEMERTCTDAQQWEELAQAFDGVGAPSAAAACHRRAEHYRAQPVGEAVCSSTGENDGCQDCHAYYYKAFMWTCGRCGATLPSDVYTNCLCEYDVQHS